MQWKGKLYPGRYQPIVDSPTWEKVQTLLDISGKQQAGEPPAEITYAGLVTCAHCGCSIVGEKKKGRYVYYHCTQGRGECKENGWVREEELDAAFMKTLKSIRLSPEMLIGVRQALKETHDTVKRQRESEMTVLSKRAGAIRRKMDAIFQDRLQGKTKEDSWRKQHNRLVEERRLVNAALRGTDRADLRFYQIGEQLLQFAEKAELMFEQGNAHTRREIVNLVLSNSRLCSGTLMNTVREPFSLFVEGGKSILARQAGLEPATHGLEGRCSIP